MLTASVTVPNPPQTKPGEQASPLTDRLPPRPQNWCGVGEGLKDATSLLHQHLYTQAEDTLLQLLEFAPMEGKAWHLLGRSHQAQGRHAKALECFERADCCYRNRNANDEAPASSRLARLLWDQGDEDGARAMLGQLMLHQPDDAELLALHKQWQHSDTQEAIA
jgi:tetratricopeptide (TPR) repeat protein